jgi:hypothetical protein
VDETLYLAAAVVTTAVVAMVATPDIRHLRRLDVVASLWTHRDALLTVPGTGERGGYVVGLAEGQGRWRRNAARDARR